jgi:hypothetical protein
MKRHHLALSAIAIGGGTAVAHAASTNEENWHLLNEIDRMEIITETTYEVRKIYPEAFDKGAIDFEVTGYAVPLTPGDMISELILLSDMGTCPFCGSLDHGVSLEVALAEAIPTFDEALRISVRGSLEKVTDPETWQAAILRNATIVTQ